jgi:hypothetical protein
MNALDLLIPETLSHVPRGDHHQTVDAVRLSTGKVRLHPRDRVVLIVVAASMAILIAVFCLGCTRVAHPLVLLVIPSPRHDIGAWLDEDTVCVAVPGTQAYRVQRRCLSMGAIRSLILTSRVADDEHGDPQ